jgi:hypothetical protein
MLIVSPRAVHFRNLPYDPIPPLVVDHHLLLFLCPFHVHSHSRWKPMRVGEREEVMVSLEYVLLVGIAL